MDEELKKRVEKATEGLPDGSYRSECPVCGGTITLTQNWGAYWLRGIVMALIVGLLTILAL